MRLGILTSHPIQYQAPWFRALAARADVEVFFAHRQTAAEQGKAGFGVAFEWDVDLLSGYKHHFLKNISANPGVNHYAGCDTPEIGDIIRKAESRKQKAERSADKADGEELKAEIQNAESETFNFQLPAAPKHGEGGSTFNFSPFDAFIVNGWYLKSYMQAVRACRAAGVPVLVRGDSQLLTPRSWIKRLGMEVKQRWLLRQFDGFLAVGRRNREYLEHFGARPEKIFFVPHFVDNEWFAARTAESTKHKAQSRKDKSESGNLQSENQLSTFNFQLSTSLRAAWGADEQTFVALFVGKFIEEKRPLDLVAAARILTTKNAKDAKAAGNMPVHLVFVGSGELGKQLRDACQVVHDAERANYQPSTINHQLPLASFAGFKNQSELPACYAAADVLVLPSESETWGLVVNEAMACGLPAIVSDAVGCAPDLIDEGKTGFTFPLGDVEALAERLAAFAKMKQAGHDFAPALAAKMNIYSLEKAVEGTVRAIEQIAAKMEGNLKAES